MNVELVKSLLTLRTGIAFVVGIAIGWIIVTKLSDWREAWKSNKQQKKQ